MKSVTIVGASLAGLRAAQTLRQEGFDGRLVIVVDEARQPYDRPPLSKGFLAGELDEHAIGLPGADDLEAEWQLGRRVTSLHLASRRLVVADGDELPFDRLVLATGTRPRRLPVLDPARGPVYELRTLDDALRLRPRLHAGARVVIVGGGFIGIELASTASALGAGVTLVSLLAPLAVAGPLASARTTRALVDHGVDLRLGRTVAIVEGDGPVEVVLDDGERLVADVVVSAVGVVPATDWLQDSGLPLDDGILCDERLAVRGTHGIVAAGDVVRWPNVRCGGTPMRIEHWTNAAEQGRAAAISLLRGTEAPPHGSLPVFWSHHFGTRVQCIGLPGLADEFELVDGDGDDHLCAVAGLRGGAVVAGVAWNRPRALVALRGRLADPLISP